MTPLVQPQRLCASSQTDTGRWRASQTGHRAEATETSPLKTRLRHRAQNAGLFQKHKVKFEETQGDSKDEGMYTLSNRIALRGSSHLLNDTPHAFSGKNTMKTSPQT